MIHQLGVDDKITNPPLKSKREEESEEYQGLRIIHPPFPDHALEIMGQQAYGFLSLA